MNQITILSLAILLITYSSAIHLHMLKKIGLIALLAGHKHHKEPHHYPVPLPVPIHAPHVIETPVHHQNHHHHHHHHEVIQVPLQVHHSEYASIPSYGQHHHDAYASEPFHYHASPYQTHTVRMPHASGGHPVMYGAMESVNHIHEVHQPSYPGPVMARSPSMPISAPGGEVVIHPAGMPQATRSEYYAPHGKPEARSDESEESDPFASNEIYKD